VDQEQGVALLSSVLRGDRVVAVNIEIMRAFVRLREILFSHAELSRRPVHQHLLDAREPLIFLPSNILAKSSARIRGRAVA